MKISDLICALSDSGATIDMIVAAVRAIEGTPKVKNNTDAERQRRCRQKKYQHIYDKCKNACTYCGTASGPFHIDRIVPICQGGNNESENLTLACAKCNLSKGGLTLEEWRSKWA